jgi:Dit-like tail protein
MSLSLTSAAGAVLGGVGFLRSFLGTGASAGPRYIFYQALDQNGKPISDNSGNPIYVAFNAFVSLVEDRMDEMQITTHPVEQGVTISDHAYRMPSTLRMRLGWSPSSPSSSGLLSPFGITMPTFTGLLGISDGEGIAYVRGIYYKLLAIMAQRPLMTIVTGKRTYPNMLLKSVQEQTDERTENSLIINAMFQELILVSTSTVQVPVNPKAQALPQQTTPTTNSGAQNLQPAPAYNGSQLT